MMRCLLVFRHGKSDWGTDTDDDRSRPLAPRGRRSAAAMGQFLAGAGEVPDLALTSPARRASETLRLAAEAGGWDCERNEREALYGTLADVLAELRRVPDTVQAVIVVGHEPTSSELAATLTGGGRIRLPTAAMLRLDLDLPSWSELSAGCGEITWLVTPRLVSARSRRR